MQYNSRLTGSSVDAIRDLRYASSPSSVTSVLPENELYFCFLSLFHSSSSSPPFLRLRHSSLIAASSLFWSNRTLPSPSLRFEKLLSCCLLTSASSRAG